VANAKLRAVFKVEILRLLPLGGTPVPVKFLAMRLGVGKRTTEYHQLREALRELAEDGHIGIEKQQGNFGYFLPPAPAPTAAPAPVDQQAPDLQAAAE
jgi:DNA-binding FadR family transcriptional regulator